MLVPSFLYLKPTCFQPFRHSSCALCFKIKTSIRLGFGQEVALNGAAFSRKSIDQFDHHAELQVNVIGAPAGHLPDRPFTLIDHLEPIGILCPPIPLSHLANEEITDDCHRSNWKACRITYFELLRPGLVTPSPPWIVSCFLRVTRQDTAL